MDFYRVIHIDNEVIDDRFVRLEGDSISSPNVKSIDRWFSCWVNSVLWVDSRTVHALSVTSVASCFRFPFARCTHTVKSPLPVHFALSSFSVLPSRIGTKLRSSSASPLLFAPLLFDLSRFNARWIFHRAAGGWSSTSWSDSLSGDTRTACRLCTVSSLVSSAFENALFSATKTSDRYSFLPHSRSDATVYSDIATRKLFLSIILSKTCSLTLWSLGGNSMFCINLVATRKSLRAWQFRLRSWFYFRHVRH